MIVYWIVQWILAVGEIYLCYCFVGALENKGLVEKNKIYIWLFSIIIGSMVLFNRSMDGGMVSWGLIIIQCIVIFFSVIGKKGSYKFAKLTVIVAYSVYLASLQLAFSFFQLAVIEELTLENAYMKDTIHTELSLGCSLLLMYLFYHIVLKYSKRNLFESYGFRNAFFVYCIIGSCVMFYSQCQMLEYGKIRSGRYFLFLIIIIIATMVALITSMNAENIDDEIKIIELKTKLLEENYQELQEIYRNYAYVGHDLKNHLLVLENYCKRGEIEKAVEYIEKIQKPIRNIKQYIKSDNEVMDVILNYKFSEAEKQGIQICVDWDSKTMVAIDDVDLCSIFSNLLDNAIKACAKGGDNEEKWIHLCWRNAGDIIFLNVENSVFKKIKKREENSRELHGYGLKSVKDKVKKYDGMIVWEEKDDRFKVAVIFDSREKECIENEGMGKTRRSNAGIAGN